LILTLQQVEFLSGWATAPETLTRNGKQFGGTDEHAQ
jgi:hypothetical protein